MSASKFFRQLAVALLTGLSMAAAVAQQANTREQEQIRRLRQQVQQLQAEQGTQQQAAQRAQAEKAEAQAKLDAAAAQLRRTQQAIADRTKGAESTRLALEALRQEHAALQASADAMKAELQDGARSLEKLRGEQAQLQRRLAGQQAAYAELDTRHGTQAQGLQACIANNQALHGLGRELLQRYLDKGVVDTAVQVEPFFQFKRVALENLVQGYQDKLDRQALKPRAVGDTPAEPARAP